MAGHIRDSIGQQLEQTSAGAGSTLCEAKARPAAVMMEAADDSEVTQSSWKDISLIDLQITVHHYMRENCTSYTSGTRARRGLPILELRQHYMSI